MEATYNELQIALNNIKDLIEDSRDSLLDEITIDESYRLLQKYIKQAKPIDYEKWVKDEFEISNLENNYSYMCKSNLHIFYDTIKKEFVLSGLKYNDLIITPQLAYQIWQELGGKE